MPTRYIGPVEFGGSTKPWAIFSIVKGDVNSVERPYVVKLFSQSQVSQHPCIAKEFICNSLAIEFDLFAPEAGIVNLFESNFIKTLNKKELNILNGKFRGNTYASELLSAVLVNEQITNPFDIDQRAMIYAFDCLVINSDRWGMRKKPNLMIYNNDFMLIDHELSFPFMDSYDRASLDAILEHFHNGRLLYQFKNHLFYNSLKTYRGIKKNLFDTFQEYLKTINIEKLHHLIEELQMMDIDVRSENLLFEYIGEIKANSKFFSDVVLGTIL